MERITIPGENGDEWAEVRDRDDLSNRQRKELRRALHLAGAGLTKLEELGYEDGDIKTWGLISDLSPEDSEPMSAYRATMVLTSLVRWSLDGDLPKTVDDVDDLPGPLYDALVIGINTANAPTVHGVDGATDPKADTDSSQSSEPSSVSQEAPPA